MAGATCRANSPNSAASVAGASTGFQVHNHATRKLLLMQAATKKKEKTNEKYGEYIDYEDIDE